MKCSVTRLHEKIYDFLILFVFSTIIYLAIEQGAFARSNMIALIADIVLFLLLVLIAIFILAKIITDFGYIIIDDTGVTVKTMFSKVKIEKDEINCIFFDILRSRIGVHNDYIVVTKHNKMEFELKNFVINNNTICFGKCASAVEYILNHYGEKADETLKN